MSKLSSSKYPTRDIKRWIVAAPGVDINNVDKVLLGRLAALAEFIGKTITINSGWRATSKQTELYIKSGGKQDSSGNWHGGDGYVARPGTSWHEYGLAVDTSTPWLKELCRSEATSKQHMLIKFGIFKPLTIGNKTSVLEDWHIQPIETMGKKALNDGKTLSAVQVVVQPKAALETLRRGDKGPKVKELQEAIKRKGYVIVPDGDFGAKTEVAVVAFQKSQKLTADGVVGPATWDRLGGNK